MQAPQACLLQQNAGARETMLYGRVLVQHSDEMRVLIAPSADPLKVSLARFLGRCCSRGLSGFSTKHHHHLARLHRYSA